MATTTCVQILVERVTDGVWELSAPSALNTSRVFCSPKMLTIEGAGWIEPPQGTYSESEFQQLVADLRGSGFTVSESPLD